MKIWSGLQAALASIVSGTMEFTGRAGSMRRSLVVTGGSAISLRVVGAAAGFATTVLLARRLGPDGYGIYALAFAVVTLLAIPAQVGLPMLVVRETARGQVAKDWPRIRGVWIWASRFALVMSVAIICLAVLADRLGPEWLELYFGPVTLVGLLLVPLIALGNLRGAALRGLKLVGAGLLPEFVARPLFFVFALAVWATWSELTPLSAMWLHVASACLAFGLGLVLLSKMMPDELRRERARKIDSSAWISATIPLAFMTGVQVFSQNVDSLILASMRTEADVGVFRAAIVTATLMIFVLQITNHAISPHLAESYARRDTKMLQKLVTHGARVAVLVALPILALVIAQGDKFLAASFGDEFERGYLALVILCCGQVANAFFGPAGILLTMTGHERYAATGMALACIVGAGLSVILVPYLGIVGSAIGSASTVIIWNIAMYVYGVRKLGVRASAWHLKASLESS